MLINFYEQLFIMSVTAGGLYLILKLLSALTAKYFTVAWHYYSNLVMYSFFVLPYYKIVSLFHLEFHLDTGSTSIMGSNQLIQPNVIEEPAANNAARLQAESYIALFLDLVPYLLMTGTIIFLIVILIKNYHLKCRIFKLCSLTAEEQTLGMLIQCKQELGIKRKISLYSTSHISTPFVYGMFKPRIVLPDIKFSPEELRYIFIHELTHWKRGDAWLKGFMLFINALHWFNPLAYMARRDIDRFCELSCDEIVVISMNHEERMRYCELILSVLWNIADHKARLVPAFSDERKHLERRITMILEKSNFKRKKGMVAIAITLTLLLGATSSVAAYAAYTINGDKETAGESVAKEGIGGFSPTDDSNAIFLDSYFKSKETISLQNGIAPSHDVKNGQIAIYKNEDKNWSLKKGQTINLEFNIESSLKDGQTAVIGYINDNIYTNVFSDKIFRDKSIEFTAPENGEYAFYLIGASSDTIKVQSLSIK